MASPHLPDAPAAGVKRPSGLNARVVGHALRRRPLAFAALLLATAATGAGVYLFLPLARVTAAVGFHLASQTPTITPGAARSAGGPAEFAAFKQTQAGYVKNQRVLSAALSDPAVKDLPAVRDADPDPMTWLDRAVKVDTKTGAELMRVTLEGDNGDELKAVLGAVSDAYLKFVGDRESAEKQGQLVNQEKAIEGYLAEISTHQKRIDTIHEVSGAPKTPEAGVVYTTLFNQRMTSQIDALQAAEQHRKLHEAALPALRKASRAGDPTGPKEPPDAATAALLEAQIDAILRQDKGLAEKEAAVAAAQEHLATVKERYAEGAPAIGKAEAAVKDAVGRRDKYKAERRAEVSKLAEEYVQTQAKARLALAEAEVEKDKVEIELANERIEKLRKEQKERANYQAELEKLQDEIAGKKKLVSDTREAVARVRVETAAPKRVTKVEDPFVLPGLEGNRRMKFALMGAIGVFFLGFAGLVGWEARTRRVTHTDEATTDLGLRLLGTVPPLGGNGTPGAPPQALAEAIDTARTMLLHGTPAGASIRTVLVTSGVAGEGKTSLAGHLAISLARAGFRTCLVDGDLQSPAAHRLFDVPAGPGLCELLRDQSGLDEVARPTPVPGLSILPAGRWDTAARQCLVGERWRRLKAELEARFDFVVIDSAPLLFMSDTLLLAREADGVVLSVLIGVSQIAHVAETAGRLQAVGANLTGAVVNGVWHKAHRAGYPYRSADAVAAGQIEEGRS